MVNPTLAPTDIPVRLPRLASASRWSDLAGVASPLLLAVAIALVSSQRPEYSNAIDTLSELGRKGMPNARWMNIAGFIPAGMLAILSARSVYRMFGPGALSAAGAVGVALAGVSLSGLGLFPMDERPPVEARELGNKIHVVFAVMGFVWLALSPLLLGMHALRIPALCWWGGLSLGTFVAVLGFGVPFFSSDAEYRGTYQRAALAAHYSWLAAICAHRLGAEAKT